jgi:hypothetical protein
MHEVKMSFETGVAQCDTGEWCWAARGRDLPEFFRSCDPSYAPTSTGWFLFGPYTTEGAARRELREFVDEFFRDAATARRILPNSGIACGGHVSGAATMATGSSTRRSSASSAGAWFLLAVKLRKPSPPHVHAAGPLFRGGSELSSCRTPILGKAPICQELMAGVQVPKILPSRHAT